MLICVSLDTADEHIGGAKKKIFNWFSLFTSDIRH